MTNDYFDHPYDKQSIATKTMKSSYKSNTTITPGNFRSLRRLCGLGIAAIGLSAPLASADSTITVQNAGFEAPTPHNPNNSTNADWTAGGWAFVGAPWTSSTANYGRLSSSALVGTVQYGPWIMNLNDGGGWVKQNLGTSVTAGDTLAVTFQVMSDTAAGQIAVEFQVGAGPTVYTQTFNNPQNNGTWVSYTLTKTVGVSGNLSVKFSNVSGRLWLDNISDVTVTPAPPPNGEPTSTNATLTAVEDTETALAAADFGYADPNSSASPLKAVRIISLPLLGTLKNGGVTLGTGDLPLEVAVADIPNLTYQSALYGYGTPYTTIGIKVESENNLWSVADGVMTVNVTHVNHPPTSTGGAVILHTNTVKTFAAANFSFADADVGDTLQAIKVVTSLPANGTLTLNGTPITSVPSADIPVASIGTLTYTPVTDFNGTDSFEFQVSDGIAFSADATMAITVTSDILVSNGSFETPGPLLGGPWGEFGSPWSVINAPGNYQQIKAADGGAFTSAPDGLWVALINEDDCPITAPLTQNLGVSVTAGDTLTVTFHSGRQLGAVGGTGVAYFDVAGTKYTTAFDTSTLAAGAWQLTTMTQTITNSGNLTLGFYGTTGHGVNAWLDNISNVSVTSGPAAGSYADWASANSVTGAVDGDSNYDGVPNGIAYFMGATGQATQPSLNPSTNTVTWPMSATFSGTFVVETSTDLGTWTPAVTQPTRNGDGNLVFTLPPGAPGGKSFVRLVVTPN